MSETASPYAVEIWLSRFESEDARPGLFNVDLFDRERSGVQASGVVDLGFGAVQIPGLRTSGVQILEAFHRGDCAPRAPTKSPRSCCAAYEAPPRATWIARSARRAGRAPTATSNGPRRSTTRDPAAAGR